MTTFFIICLLIQPWLFVPIKGIINQFRMPQGVFLNFIFLGMIFFMFFSGIKNFYRNKYLAVFIAYLFLMIFATLFIPIVFQKPVNNYLIYPSICVILTVFASYIALSYFDKEDYIRIAKALCLSGTLIASFGLLQFIGFDPLRSIAHYNCVNRLSACLDNPNLVGNYLAIIAPLFLYFKSRKYLIGYLLSLLCVLATKSHIAYVCFVVGSLLTLFLQYKHIKNVRVIVMSLGLSGLVWLYFNQWMLKMDSLLDGRLYCWQIVIDLIKKSPLFGLGLGVFSMLRIETVGTGGVGNAIWFEAHCDPLQYILEIGLVGVLLAGFVIVNALRNFSFKERIGLSYFSMFVTFLLCSCVSFPIEVPSLAVLGLIGFWATERL